jgi:uncharacterized membrane protein (UPF0127 family)
VKTRGSSDSLVDSLLEPPPNLPEPVRGYLVRAATEPGRRVLNWVVGTLLVVAFFAFIAVGANGPANPRLGTPSTTVTTLAPKPSRIAGFNEVRFFVSQAAPGSPFTTGPAPAGRPFCGVLADTPQLQAQGLMNRNDLANYDGMFFTFPADTNVGFFMKNTRFALTLAWFDNQGRFLGSVDMPPCPARVTNCPTYSPPGGIRFRYGLEVAQGGLSRLGVGAGSTVSLAGGC